MLPVPDAMPSVPNTPSKRSLSQAMHDHPDAPVLTVEQVEEIARRVFRESA